VGYAAAPRGVDTSDALRELVSSWAAERTDEESEQERGRIRAAFRELTLKEITDGVDQVAGRIAGAAQVGVEVATQPLVSCAGRACGQQTGHGSGWIVGS
jgi:hypothetical protein